MANPTATIDAAEFHRIVTENERLRGEVAQLERDDEAQLAEIAELKQRCDEADKIREEMTTLRNTIDIMLGR